jgi:hypothetical protein
VLQPDSRFYPRVFGLVTAGVLGLALFRILEPFRDSILWALLLAFLLFPVNRFGLAVTLFLLFFFLRDGEDGAQRLMGLAPMDADRKAHLIVRPLFISGRAQISTLPWGWPSFGWPRSGTGRRRRSSRVRGRRSRWNWVERGDAFKPASVYDGEGRRGEPSSFPRADLTGR